MQDASGTGNNQHMPEEDKTREPHEVINNEQGKGTPKDSNLEGVLPVSQQNDGTEVPPEGCCEYYPEGCTLPYRHEGLCSPVNKNKQRKNKPKHKRQAALYAAIRSYNGKVGDLNFTALTAATHAPDVDCNPLTAESDSTAIKAACEALGRALEGARQESQLPADREKKRAGLLQACLAYPMPKLKKAFMAHLQEEAALEGGGWRVESAFEAMLAARMQVIVSELVKPATEPRANSDDYVEMKRLFRAICKNYNDEWVASCGSDTDLDKANAAVLDLDEGQRLEIPNAVKDKWQAALRAVHGEKCKFKNRTCLTGGKEITVWHIYHFSEAGQPHPYHPYDPYDLYDPYHPRPKSPLVPPVPPV